MVKLVNVRKVLRTRPDVTSTLELFAFIFFIFGPFCFIFNQTTLLFEQQQHMLECFPISSGFSLPWVHSTLLTPFSSSYHTTTRKPSLCLQL